MPTDPYTGNDIPPGATAVRCPRGHVHLPESWQAAGNRCCYPGCNYVGAPVPQILARTPIASTRMTGLPSATSNRGSHSGMSTSATVSPLPSFRPRWWPTLWSSFVITAFTLTIALLLFQEVPVGEILSEFTRSYLQDPNTVLPVALAVILLTGILLYIVRTLWSRRWWFFLGSSLVLMTFALFTTSALLEWVDLDWVMSSLALPYERNAYTTLLGLGTAFVVTAILLATVRRRWSQHWWPLFWSSLSVAFCALLTILALRERGYLESTVEGITRSNFSTPNASLIGLGVAAVLGGLLLAIVRMLWLRHSWPVLWSSLGVSTFTLLSAYVLLEMVDLDGILTKLASTYLPAVDSSWLSGAPVIMIAILLTPIRVFWPRRR